MINSELPLIAPDAIPMNSGIIFVDARSGPGAYARYAANHLEGARHSDLDLVLTQKPTDPAYGGRHPLPHIQDFARSLGQLGITPTSRVVVYDDKNGAFAAARFWWMMRAVGHEKIQVVDGGLDALVRAAMPMTTSVSPHAAVAPYPVDTWKLPTVEIDEVARAASDPSALVIDVREGYRYRGESEPIDLVAGHIPGAVNVPYLENLKPDGQFHSVDELAAQYQSVIGSRNLSRVIVHCGSGVTACHTLLAMEQAGLRGANLYVGSWSEWSRQGRPIGSAESPNV